MNDKVSREELESKLRSWEQSTAGDLEHAKSMGVGAAVAVSAAAIGTAYFLGKRRRQSEATFVEVQRVS